MRKLVQNVVVDEELVQNVVMDGKFVKNFVVGAKVDPNPVIENCRKNILMRMRRDCRSEFKAEIPYLEQPFVCDDLNVKESKPTCEDLHETMPCYGQQHFAASNDLQEHLRRHS